MVLPLQMPSAEDFLSEVQSIYNETSDKFESMLTVQTINEDILVDLKWFNNTIRLICFEGNTNLKSSFLRKLWKLNLKLNTIRLVLKLM